MSALSVSAARRRELQADLKAQRIAARKVARLSLEAKEAQREQERRDALRAKAPNACALAGRMTEAIHGRGVGSIALEARLVCISYMADHGQEIEPGSSFEESTMELLGSAILDHGTRNEARA